MAELKKAVTFSFDDGVTQDVRLIELFNKYGLKATFNLNSSFLGNDGMLSHNSVSVSHRKIRARDVPSVYAGHEVAVHTLTHPNLCELSEEEIFRQVEGDRLALSDLVGYEVTGMAYPGGGVNQNERVADVVRQTGVKFARTTVETFSFKPEKDFYRLNPTIHCFSSPEKLDELTEAFLNSKTNTPQIFYIWGHSYEFDFSNTWVGFEEALKKLAGKKDVLYGTNTEVFKYFCLI